MASHGAISTTSACSHREQLAGETSHAVEFLTGGLRLYGDGLPSFTLCVQNQEQLEFILQGDLYSMARAFIRGEFDVRGDFVAAAKYLMDLPRRGIAPMLRLLAAWGGPWRLESLAQSRPRAARNIRFHYDRSNGFYHQFLDARMVYSCAYFKNADWSLDQAQLAKLDYICRKLDLQPGERFLDVGSGWGGLVMHAAQNYRVEATGCTLSARQEEYTSALIRECGLMGQVRILEKDCRDLQGTFDKIASVGMFEHVGRRRLFVYFKKMHALLAPQGLFLNHGIMRPQKEGEGPESQFIRHRVFPGGELPHLADVIRQAERAGFEVLDVENLRPHYALTCRAWVARLEQNARVCLRLVDGETYRTWLVYLSASAINFERGRTDVYQVLLAKRSHPQPRRLSREHFYR